jgi:hypothetical protein
MPCRTLDLAEREPMRRAPAEQRLVTEGAQFARAFSDRDRQSRARFLLIAGSATIAFQVTRNTSPSKAWLAASSSDA